MGGTVGGNGCGRGSPNGAAADSGFWAIRNGESSVLSGALRGDGVICGPSAIRAVGGAAATACAPTTRDFASVGIDNRRLDVGGAVVGGTGIELALPGSVWYRGEGAADG